MEKTPFASKKWLAWLIFTVLAFVVTSISLVIGDGAVSQVASIVTVVGGVTGVLIGGQSVIDTSVRTAKAKATESE